MAAGARGERGGGRGPRREPPARLERRAVGGERGLRAGDRGGGRLLGLRHDRRGPGRGVAPPGDAAGQARAAFAIVEGALGEAGFTLDEVVRTRMYIVDPADADAVAASTARSSSTSGRPRRWSSSPRLITPSLLVEVEAEARKG